MTYFAAPGAGKVAFAPELPLSDIGKQRGERDVWIAFEAFASAVSSARGVSRDKLIALDADALTGQAAVDAGLADGVASLDEVLEYALAMAGAEGVATSDEAAPTDDNESGVAARRMAMGEQPESPEKVKKLDEEARKMAEKKMIEKLAAKYSEELDEKYAEELDDEADEEEEEEDKAPTPKHLADEDEDEDSEEEDKHADEDEEEDEEEAPKSERKMAGGRKMMPPPKKTQPPPEKQDRSVAALFGLRAGASAPAVKAAALPYVSLARAAMALTGARTIREAEGALRALADDAADAVRLRSEVRTVKAREARRERVALLRKLASANLPGYTRGDLFVDLERDGKLVSAPAPAFAEMKLGTLRGLVAAKLANAPARTSSPWEPSRDAASRASSQASIDIAAPTVSQFSGRTHASADKLAAAAAALAQMGAFSNG